METGDTIETGRDSWRYSRDEANEIATGFALATTSSDCHASLAMTRKGRARNDMEGYYPMLHTYGVSPIYLN